MSILDDAAREREELLAELAEATAGPVVRTLAEILENPDALKPPRAVAPRIAWESRVTMLAGREKLGKSTLASAVASGVSRGAFLFGERCAHGPVLIFNLEEFVGDVAQRLVRFGADPENVHIVDRLTDPLREFEELVLGLAPGLVIVDTLTAFADLLPGGAPDAGSAAEWTSIMMRLARPCRDSGAALLVLHHARKSDGKYRDSTAIGAGVDMILEMHEGKDSETRKVEAKGRFPVNNYSFAMVGDALQLTDGELSVEARVLTYIINNPGCSSRQVRDGVGARWVCPVSKPKGVRRGHMGNVWRDYERPTTRLASRPDRARSRLRDTSRGPAYRDSARWRLRPLEGWDVRLRPGD